MRAATTPHPAGCAIRTRVRDELARQLNELVKPRHERISSFPFLFIAFFMPTPVRTCACMSARAFFLTQIYNSPCIHSHTCKNEYIYSKHMRAIILIIVFPRRTELLSSFLTTCDTSLTTSHRSHARAAHSQCFAPCTCVHMTMRLIIPHMARSLSPIRAALLREQSPTRPMLQRVDIRTSNLCSFRVDVAARQAPSMRVASSTTRSV
jgi:hypothetical protein